MKFINVKTKEIVDLEKGKDVFYQPYLGRLKDAKGRTVGHQHMPAYFDREGTEYREKPKGKMAIGTKKIFPEMYKGQDERGTVESCVIWNKKLGDQNE